RAFRDSIEYRPLRRGLDWCSARTEICRQPDSGDPLGRRKVVAVRFIEGLAARNVPPDRWEDSMASMLAELRSLVSPALRSEMTRQTHEPDYAIAKAYEAAIPACAATIA